MHSPARKSKASSSRKQATALEGKAAGTGAREAVGKGDKQPELQGSPQVKVGNPAQEQHLASQPEAAVEAKQTAPGNTEPQALPVQHQPAADAAAADTAPSKTVTSSAAERQEPSKPSVQDVSGSQTSPKTPAAGDQQPKKAYPGSEELMLKLLVASSTIPQPPRNSTARAKARLSPASQKATDPAPAQIKTSAVRASPKQAAAAASPQPSPAAEQASTTAQLLARANAQPSPPAATTHQAPMQPSQPRAEPAVIPAVASEPSFAQIVDDQAAQDSLTGPSEADSSRSTASAALSVGSAGQRVSIPTLDTSRVEGFVSKQSAPVKVPKLRLRGYANSSSDEDSGSELSPGSSSSSVGAAGGSAQHLGLPVSTAAMQSSSATALSQLMPQASIQAGTLEYGLALPSGTAKQVLRSTPRPPPQVKEAVAEPATPSGARQA